MLAGYFYREEGPAVPSLFNGQVKVLCAHDEVSAFFRVPLQNLSHLYTSPGFEPMALLGGGFSRLPLEDTGATHIHVNTVDLLGILFFRPSFPRGVLSCLMLTNVRW